jgi:hypothetical protein
MLYSAEFLDQVRKRLAPGGLYVQWAPTQRTVETFVAVFPHALLLMPAAVLVGSNDPIRFDADALRAAFRDPANLAHLQAGNPASDDWAAMFAGGAVRWTPGQPRSVLPRSRRIDLRAPGVPPALKPEFARGFLYADCWVDDARLVVLNACDAAARGARIATRTRVLRAEPLDGLWRATLAGQDGRSEVAMARAVVNAAGPWAGEVLGATLGINRAATLRLGRARPWSCPRVRRSARRRDERFVRRAAASAAEVAGADLPAAPARRTRRAG